MGTDGKRKENTGVAWEPIENARETQVLRVSLWKPQGKHTCCVETYGKRINKTRVAWEPIENAKKVYLKWKLI